MSNFDIRSHIVNKRITQQIDYFMSANEYSVNLFNIYSTILLASLSSSHDIQ